VKWEAPAEVTACVAAYNGMLVLPRCLEALARGWQSVPMHLIVGDDGSTDGMWEYVGSNAFRRHWTRRGFASVRVLPSPGEDIRDANGIRRKERHCLRAKQRLAALVETGWTLFVDQDVLTPPGGVRALLDAAAGKPGRGHRLGGQVGILGILAARQTDHVRGECTLYRRAFLEQLEGWELEGCFCRWLHHQAIARGFEVGYLRGWQARDLSEEMAGMGYLIQRSERTLIVRGADAAREVLERLGLPGCSAADGAPLGLGVAGAELGGQAAASGGAESEAADGRGSAGSGIRKGP